MTTICEICKNYEPTESCSGCVEGSKFEPADDQQKAWVADRIRQLLPEEL